MANALTTALRISTSVWSDVLGNPDLRRLEVGRVWSVAAEAITTVGLGLYAFRTHGVSAVALVVAIQVLPGALTAPVLATMSDRLRRGRVMGPAVAALVLATTGRVAWLFVVAALGFAASGISAARISRTDAVRLPIARTVGLRAAISGFGAAVRDPGTRLLLSLFVVKNLGRG